MIPTRTLQHEETLVITYQVSKCPKAFGDLYQILYSPLFDYTCKIAKNADDAFDITQEAFIKAAQEIDNLRQPITFRFWLFRIAKHLCIAHLKKSSKNSKDIYDTDNAIQDYDTSEAIEKEEQLTKLALLMSELSPEEQYLLTAKYSDGKSIKELVSETNLGGSAIKMKLMRARKKVEFGMISTC